MISESLRVLIADDEFQLLQVLVRVLEKQGYSVVSATDGKDAIRALRDASAPIDAIVLDAAIGPDGAGEVLEALAAERPRIGVVVTSGDQLADPIRFQLQTVRGIFLFKPFPPSALLRAVEDALAKGNKA